MNKIICFLIAFVLNNLNNNLNITTHLININKSKYEGYDQRFNESTDLNNTQLYNIYKNFERIKLLQKLNDTNINSINKLKFINEHFFDENISSNIYKNLENDY